MRWAALLVAAVVPASAQGSLRLGGRGAEDALRRFIDQDPGLKARIGDGARREEASLADGRDADLRDSVSDAPVPGELGRRLRTVSAEDRARLLERLPGWRRPEAPACPTLAACPAPALAAEAADAERLPETLRGLVRPWMLLQRARGAKTVLAAVDGPGDAALTLTLKGLGVAPLTLNVSPRAAGGYRVWFDQAPALAVLYGRERTAALAR